MKKEKSCFVGFSQKSNPSHLSKAYLGIMQADKLGSIVKEGMVSVYGSRSIDLETRPVISKPAFVFYPFKNNWRKLENLCVVPGVYFLFIDVDGKDRESGISYDELYEKVLKRLEWFGWIKYYLRKSRSGKGWHIFIPIKFLDKTHFENSLHLMMMLMVLRKMYEDVDIVDKAVFEPVRLVFNSPYPFEVRSTKFTDNKHISYSSGGYGHVKSWVGFLRDLYKNNRSRFASLINDFQYFEEQVINLESYVEKQKANVLYKWHTLKDNFRTCSKWNLHYLTEFKEYINYKHFGIKSKKKKTKAKAIDIKVEEKGKRGRKRENFTRNMDSIESYNTGSFKTIWYNIRNKLDRFYNIEFFKSYFNIEDDYTPEKKIEIMLDFFDNLDNYEVINFFNNFGQAGYFAVFVLLGAIFDYAAGISGEGNRYICVRIAPDEKTPRSAFAFENVPAFAFLQSRNAARHFKGFIKKFVNGGIRPLIRMTDVLNFVVAVFYNFGIETLTRDVLRLLDYFGILKHSAFYVSSGTLDKVMDILADADYDPKTKKFYVYPSKQFIDVFGKNYRFNAVIRYLITPYLKSKGMWKKEGGKVKIEFEDFDKIASDIYKNPYKIIDFKNRSFFINNYNHYAIKYDVFKCGYSPYESLKKANRNVSIKDIMRPIEREKFIKADPEIEFNWKNYKVIHANNKEHYNGDIPNFENYVDFYPFFRYAKILPRDMNFLAKYRLFVKDYWLYTDDVLEKVIAKLDKPINWYSRQKRIERVKDDIVITKENGEKISFKELSNFDKDFNPIEFFEENKEMIIEWIEKYGYLASLSLIKSRFKDGHKFLKVFMTEEDYVKHLCVDRFIYLNYVKVINKPINYFNIYKKYFKDKLKRQNLSYVSRFSMQELVTYFRRFDIRERFLREAPSMFEGDIYEDEELRGYAKLFSHYLWIEYGYHEHYSEYSEEDFDEAFEANYDVMIYETITKLEKFKGQELLFNLDENDRYFDWYLADYHPANLFFCFTQPLNPKHKKYFTKKYWRKKEKLGEWDRHEDTFYVLIKDELDIDEGYDSFYNIHRDWNLDGFLGIGYRDAVDKYEFVDAMSVGDIEAIIDSWFEDEPVKEEEEDDFSSFTDFFTNEPVDEDRITGNDIKGYYVKDTNEKPVTSITEFVQKILADSRRSQASEILQI